MKCNEFQNSSGSDPFHIGTEFGGIPSNLLTNIIGWIVIILMFVFTRKSALSVMTNNLERNWTRIFRLFLGNSSVRESENNSDKTEQVPNEATTEHDSHNVSHTVVSGDSDMLCNNSIMVDTMLETRRRELARYQSRGHDQVDGVISWLQQSLQCFSFSDETMEKLTGPDGLQYLRYE